jgi:hypothetical protein
MYLVHTTYRQNNHHEKCAGIGLNGFMLIAFQSRISLKRVVCLIQIHKSPGKAGPSQGLYIRGTLSTVVGIICFLVEIGLTVVQKTGEAKAPLALLLATAL